jgi:hypothetical protein
MCGTKTMRKHLLLHDTGNSESIVNSSVSSSVAGTIELI